MGRQLSFKREHCGVVPVQGPRSRISKTSHLKLKREVSDGKKVQDFDYVSDRRRRSREARNGFVKADVVKKVFVYMYLRDCFAFNPSTTTVNARSAFYPSLRFTLSLQSSFYTQSAFYPWSAVCSPQSAVRSLRFTLTDFPISKDILFCLNLPASKNLPEEQIF